MVDMAMSKMNKYMFYRYKKCICSGSDFSLNKV